MLEVDGYSVAEEIASGPHSHVYVGVRRSDGQGVVLKLYDELQEGLAGPKAVREFELLSRIDSPGVVRPVALEQVGECHVLILERAPGFPLSRYLESCQRLDVESFLVLALHITEGLAAVHAARIVHKDIKLSNIMVEPETLETCIIDFGISAELGKAHQAEERRVVEGTLHYLAPEQTGRTGIGVDFRTDLYSLGGAFYELLTGKPPFNTSRMLGLIHAHLASVPAAPRTLCPELPDVLSRLLMKLLEKDPDARYQSAFGLRADLQECLRRLGRDGRIEPDFVLGTRDASDRLRFTQKIYGREREQAALDESLDRAIRGGVELLLVSGPPGIGKSSLATLLRRRLAESGGYMAEAKFDPERKKIPYAGFSAVLGSLLDQLLTESTDRFQQWREHLRTSLGSIGVVLLELAPGLRLLVDDFPDVPVLSPAGAGARLGLAVSRFLSMFASPTSPLVVVLDDLQWADSGSLSLLESVLKDSGEIPLLVIGTVREDAAPGDGGLQEMLERIHGLASLRTLTLGPLCTSATNAMLADVLRHDPAETARLAELLALKTLNNPLQVRRLLEVLWERGLLRYEYGQGWQWNLAGISELDVTDAAAGFMVGMLDKLPERTRSLLTVASLIGTTFDLDGLLELAGGDRLELLQILTDLMHRGLLAPCREGFRFTHDRIREVAGAELSDDERARLECEAGLLLLARVPESERSSRIFEIVEHLNRGLRHLPEGQRLPLVQLNVQAGRQALAAGAGAESASFFDSACSLLCEEDWANERGLVFELYVEASEAAFQCADYPQALDFLHEVDRLELSRGEFTRVAVKRIQIFCILKGAEDCSRYVLEVLRQLGLRWPPHPSRLRVTLAVWLTRFALWQAYRRQVIRPIVSDDLSWLPIRAVLGMGGAALARVDAHLPLMSSCFVLRRSLRDGYSGAFGYTLGSFALWEFLLVRKPERARRGAAAARRWRSQPPDPLYENRSEFQLAAILEPFLKPRRDALAPLARVAARARELGDAEFSNYARFMDAYLRALAGDPIPDSQRALDQVAQQVARCRHDYPEAQRCADVFRWLGLEEVDDTELAQAVACADASPEDRTPDAGRFTRAIWSLVLCVHRHHELALAHSDALMRRLSRIAPYVHVTHILLYRGLAASAMAGQSAGRLRRHYWRELRRSVRLLARDARCGPDFAHMHDLLDAEVQALRGNVEGAARLYDRAARLALAQGFRHHAAMAFERHGLLLDRRRLHAAARVPLLKALSHYRAWGAMAKVAALEGDLEGWTQGDVPDLLLED